MREGWTDIESWGGLKGDSGSWIEGWSGGR